MHVVKLYYKNNLEAELRSPNSFPNDFEISDLISRQLLSKPNLEKDYIDIVVSKNGEAFNPMLYQKQTKIMKGAESYEQSRCYF